MVFKVGIDKAYFPPNSSSGVEFTSLWELPVTVRANSRSEAAIKAWISNGGRWLGAMVPYQGNLPRKVSLYVDAPDAKSQGTLTRLVPISIQVTKWEY